MEEHVYKKIEAYISGSMSTEDAQQFELEMEMQPELKEEVALYTSINHHLTETEYDDVIPDSDYKKELDTYLKNEEAVAIKKKLSRVKEEYMATLQKEKPKSKIRPLYYILSSAAVIALVFGLLFTKNSNEDLYANYYQSSDLPSFTSRSDQTSLLSKASINFKEGNLETSLTTFQEYITKTEDVDPLVYVYTGLIYSENQELQKAIAQFDLLEQSKNLDRSRALWYKALTYLKFEKMSKAKEMLTVILENRSNYKYQEAKELLDKL